MRPSCALMPIAVLLLAAGCAGQRYIYVAPPGIDQKTLEADHRACIEESGITRLDEDQKLLEQQCMMTRGYQMRSAP
jgi:hypothetical protein